MAYDADVIVVGAGLAGLAATAELADAGRRVLLLDQEPEQSLGGQAHWSFGGLFFVDSPEQRRLRIKHSHELAWQDWLGTAGFDRPEDHWPRRWAVLRQRVEGHHRGKRQEPDEDYGSRLVDERSGAPKIGAEQRPSEGG